MTSKEIRQSFLNFFASKNHRIVPSSPVIPHGDPTLLFTNAGMNQFKDVFLGIGKRDYTRAADTQKCIRVSGKHNDLEEVGFDTFHHTFFEMLGNWSFGDYYKREAIYWAWELLTDVWKLDPKRLHATVYRTDDEAFNIWSEILPQDRIHKFDEKDNFWEMGETGPCGPCSEIHYDRTSNFSGGLLVNAGKPEVIEIWNLVFIQYNRKSDGSLELLESKHIDTGMGFERITAVIQGVTSNYDTDIFSPIIQEIEALSGKKYSQTINDTYGIAMRVIADHIRTLTFAIADGAIPGNDGRGYVLRRILRRAVRFAKNIGFSEPILYHLVNPVIDNMGYVFPEIVKNKEIIQKIIKGEEENFLQTLEKGLEKIDDIIKISKEKKINQIKGSDAFQLYDSFGFPLDLTELIARENNMTVDKSEFDSLMLKQKERSRNARKVHSNEIDLPIINVKSLFTGYSEIETEAKVLFVKENMIICDKTPFYAESGGQVSDTGQILLAGEIYNVIDVKKSGDAIIHICDKDVEYLIGENAYLKVDAARRKDITRNHSATHILHEALRQTLGSHIQQAGSLVAPDYLRFDFNHFDKLSEENINDIEEIVNKKIFEQIPVIVKTIRLEEARQNPNIKMFFGDKYSDIVRVVIIDNKYSLELCGGTHVNNSIEIGLFKIISESSIAAGVRRIEAITGRAIENYIKNLNNKYKSTLQLLEESNNKIKQLEKEISSNKISSISNSIEEWIKSASQHDEIIIIANQVEVEDMDSLRMIGELLRDKLGKRGVGLLVSVFKGKVQIVCVVTDDLKDKYPAGKIVSETAKIIGGSGGGKAHLATAGGKDITKIKELITKFPSIVNEFISKNK